MKRKILILISTLCISLSANDIELVGKTSVENANEIKRLLKKMDYFNRQLIELKKEVKNISENKISIVSNYKKSVELTSSTNMNVSKVESDDNNKFVMVTANALKIRRNPSVHSSVLGYVHKDEVYKVIEFGTEKTNWVYIGSGFISKKFVKEID